MISKCQLSPSTSSLEASDRKETPGEERDQNLRLTLHDYDLGLFCINEEYIPITLVPMTVTNQSKTFECARSWTWPSQKQVPACPWRNNNKLPSYHAWSIYKRRSSFWKRYGFLRTCPACDDQISAEGRPEICQLNQSRTSFLKSCVSQSGFFVIDSPGPRNDTPQERAVPPWSQLEKPVVLCYCKPLGGRPRLILAISPATCPMIFYSCDHNFIVALTKLLPPSQKLPSWQCLRPSLYNRSRGESISNCRIRDLELLWN